MSWILPENTTFNQFLTDEETQTIQIALQQISLKPTGYKEDVVQIVVILPALKKELFQKLNTSSISEIENLKIPGNVLSEMISEIINNNTIKLTT